MESLPIFEMNNLLTQMYKFNSLGQLPVSDYNVMAHNIIRSLNMYIERVVMLPTY
ncbi:hypothetical protein [Escherichia coli]|uniref:hypothetical protein n=1 Tax=Escherichia coli TaxID=562 RepID=UPI0013E2E6B6|nr:hypothetical protein [Escherichia coli]